MHLLMHGLGIVGAVLSVSILTGCASTPAQWEKLGANPNDFTADRYACMQESQQRRSSAYVDKYGGAANSTVVTNNNLFAACMNSHGWSLAQKRAPEEQAAISARAKEILQPIADELRQLCSREDLRPHYSKTACNPEEATLEQLADKSKITNAEKVALNKLRSEAASINKRAEAQISEAFDPKTAKTMIQWRQNVAAEIDRYVLDFYDGRLTRGEFNRRRQEHAMNLKKSTNWEVS